MTGARGVVLPAGLMTLTGPVAAAEAVTASAMSLRVAISLLLVIALIGALAVVLRRLPGLGMARGGELRLLGTVAVGHRERVVLLETGGVRVLVGVAPGRVQPLHVLPADDARVPMPTASSGRAEPVLAASGSIR
ncbi:MAG: hypothetical protein AMXMBFR76_17360 [Pseudomonadota bacterium]